MRAIVFHRGGGPEVLEAANMPEPALRDTDILVEVHASSVNPIDTKLRSGGPGREPPVVLGFDVSGVVAKVGARATQWKVGDEVYAAPNLFRDGANAELVAVDGRTAAARPRSVDHATAAALPLVGQTAWEALHLRARIQPGQTVLVLGASGGVGHIAVQLARLHGCRVIATAGRDESVTFCREVLKAHEVIDYRRDDVVERVKGLTGGKGVPVVFDPVGGDNFAKSLDCAAINAQVVTIVGANTLDRAQSLLFKNVTLHYEFMGVPAWQELEPEQPGRILGGLANLVDGGLLRVHVSQRLPLERVADGHRQIETGHTVGKIAITVD